MIFWFFVIAALLMAALIGYYALGLALGLALDGDIGGGWHGEILSCCVVVAVVLARQESWQSHDIKKRANHCRTQNQGVLRLFRFACERSIRLEHHAYRKLLICQWLNGKMLPMIKQHLAARDRSRCRGGAQASTAGAIELPPGTLSVSLMRPWSALRPWRLRRAQLRPEPPSSAATRNP